MDGTGIEGGWDFALTFSRNAALAGGRGGGEPLEPTGAFTLFEALEKQLIDLSNRNRRKTNRPFVTLKICRKKASIIT